MTIAPGVYRIRNAKTKTIFDLSREKGFRIHGHGQHDGPNQHWFVQHLGEGVILKNVESGQFVYTTSLHNGSKLFGSGNFTVWNISRDGNEWTISFPGTNYIIELESGNQANGTAIQLWNQTGEIYQKWIFEKLNEWQLQPLNHQPPPQQHQPPQPFQLIHQQPTPSTVLPGTYFLRNVMSGTLISLNGGSPEEGAEISGCNHSGGNHQKWQIQPTGHGPTITLRNGPTNTYLWFQSESFVPSVLVKPSYHPQEYVISAANRGFIISPAQQPNHAVSLFNGSADNGTKIGIWYNEQQDNQKWYLDHTICEVRQPDFISMTFNTRTS
ncbi:ricin-type beta-trefoil lectin domain protein [Rhizoctonia solani 123E]|uniref:Ricin-type beta-trefoil lectin domain protein n=1 Tax=Rhizoctonia solani 123E TaxID=1423351 RepID=A0A074RQM2_9AGAM|nr:ricin-type beta-trefoil lectin domain protein [Rhizoctonia solani 123E]